MADNQYISARLGFMHTLYPVALQNASIAVEMYLKCLLKIKGETGKFRHSLLEGFKQAKINLAPDMKELVENLQNAYERDKYPDSWEERDVIWADNLDRVDELVCQIRNLIIKTAGKIDSVTDYLKVIKTKGFIFADAAGRYGVLTLKEAFIRGNNAFTRFKFLE